MRPFVFRGRTARPGAVAAGSPFVFQGRHHAVLINHPAEATRREQLFAKV